MKQSTLLSSTLRELPADAEVKSHQLLLKSGFIRQLASGIYSYLPLGYRVLRKIESIVRDEMNRAGAQEILMPALQPAELWKESGRYDAYGPELIRLQDRHKREFALGPTHEEVITQLVNHEINSYKRLPVTLYQIQTKFRDERRPRFGLLRSREFLMKDAYSFDTSWKGLDRSYQQMFEAYTRIFQRCGLHFEAVEADGGAIGGEGGTHEFMALSDTGEDTIVSCSSCHYAANLEKAESHIASEIAEKAPTHNGIGAQHTKIKTPAVRTINELTTFLQVRPEEIIKTLIYLVDHKPAAVLVRGDHEVNETKLKNFAQAEHIELADAVLTESITGAPVGFAGPIGLNIPIYVDNAVTQMQTSITGANEADFHFADVVPGRDFSLDSSGDFRNVTEGDPCPRCADGEFHFIKGIELGHIFKLGTQYSEALHANFLDENGREKPFVMGCYGIGVSRVISAIVEQNHDDKGIIWPMSVAPFHVHLVPISAKDEVQMQLAEQLYGQLNDRGIDVLLDDRHERAGVKFNDADLIGIPIRIVIGKDAVNKNVEYVDRRNQQKLVMSVDDAAMEIINGLQRQ